MMMKRNSVRALVLAAAGLLVVSTGCDRRSDGDVGDPAAGSGPRAVPTSTTIGTTAPPRSAAGSYADVVDRVAPAVVTIRSARRARAPQQYPFRDDPFFHDFFGRSAPGAMQPQERTERGLGSGVIFSAEGLILTNHHVIDGAEEIVVELADRRTLAATVVGSDPPSDLAVLRVEAAGLPTLAFGNSDNVRVGDVVLAVGNPLGVGQTVTSGIISAKGRTTGLSDGSFESFLQTDAAINQGNSGGALVSTAGELVGINSQIVSTSGGFIGIGFAIPSNMARDVTTQLASTGRVRRGQLGVTIQPLTQDLALRLGSGQARGVVVAGVEPGSAAAEAGVEPGDVIVGFDGTPIEEGNILRNLIASKGPGASVELRVLRGGAERTLRATLGELELQPRGR